MSDTTARWQVKEDGVWCHYQGEYVTSTDGMGCGCSDPDPEWPKSDEWMKATHPKAMVLVADDDIACAKYFVTSYTYPLGIGGTG